MSRFRTETRQTLSVVSDSQSQKSNRDGQQKSFRPAAVLNRRESDHDKPECVPGRENDRTREEGRRPPWLYPNCRTASDDGDIGYYDNGKKQNDNQPQREGILRHMKMLKGQPREEKRG